MKDKHQYEENKYSSVLVRNIFDKSLELGVCARCGSVVVFKVGDVVGKLHGEMGGILFYTCNGCSNIMKGKFFKTRWYEPFINERFSSRRNNEPRKSV